MQYGHNVHPTRRLNHLGLPHPPSGPPQGFLTLVPTSTWRDGPVDPRKQPPPPLRNFKQTPGAGAHGKGSFEVGECLIFRGNLKSDYLI